MSLFIFLGLLFVVFVIWLKDKLTPPWTAEQAERHIYGGMTRKEWQDSIINKKK